MEVATPESVSGLRRSDSKNSSETLVTLSILQLIRFFDSFDQKYDDLDEVSESDPLTPERCESLAGKQSKREGKEDWKSPGSENSVPTPNLNDDEKGLALSSSGEEIAINSGSSSTYAARIDRGQAEKNFRPRDSGIIDLSNTELPKDRTSRSFSIRSFHAKNWMRSATVFFKQNKQKKQKSEVYQKYKLSFPVHLAGPPALSIQKPDRSATLNPAKRMSSTLFTCGHNSETNLENMVFLPKTHPLPQNYPSVKDVEDIADTQGEYSIPPNEWSGTDPTIKASDHSDPVKSRWDKWHFSMKIKKLQKKLKSSFASGTHKTHTFRVPS